MKRNKVQDLAFEIDSKYKLDHDQSGKIILFYKQWQGEWIYTKIQDLKSEWSKFMQDHFCEWFDFKIALQYLADLNNAFEVA